MMFLLATAWACDGEACLEKARVARNELRLEDSAALYGEACDAGLPDGCARLAFARYYGNGIERDEQRAVEEFGAACDAGSLYGCVQQRSQDEPEAQHEPWFREQCEAGESSACYQLGRSIAQRDAGIGAVWLVQACDQGVGAGCTLLGTLYHRGDGMPEDQDKALALYDQGCGMGSITGCLYAEMYGPDFDEPKVIGLCDSGMEEACSVLGNKHGREGDFSGALAWFEKGCAADDADSCSQVGSLLIGGPEGVAADPDRGEALLRDQCDEGVGAACGLVGMYVNMGELTGEPGDALAFSEKGCALDDGYSCFLKAGLLFATDPAAALLSAEKSCENGYDEGCFAAVRHEPSLERARAACTRGDAEACVILGQFQLSVGDHKSAMQQFAASCGDGFQDGCFRQGLLWMDERTSLYDAARGVERMQRLCEADHGDACTMLAVAYLEGTVLAFDAEASFEHFARGCDLGAAAGCRLTALAYEGGVGVKKSRRKSKKYLKRACALGHTESC